MNKTSKKWVWSRRHWNRTKNQYCQYRSLIYRCYLILQTYSMTPVTVRFITNTKTKNSITLTKRQRRFLAGRSFVRFCRNRCFLWLNTFVMLSLRSFRRSSIAQNCHKQHDRDTQTTVFTGCHSYVTRAVRSQKSRRSFTVRQTPTKVEITDLFYNIIHVVDVHS